MKETFDKILSQAIQKGMCEEGKKRLRESGNIADLIAFYLECPDWCLERDFPSWGILRGLAGDCEEWGIYVGKTFHGELLNSKKAYIFHHCRGYIRTGLNMELGIIPMLYLGNHCRLRIVGCGDVVPASSKNRSVVPLYLFGEHDLSARDNKHVTFVRHHREVKE